MTPDEALDLELAVLEAELDVALAEADAGAYVQGKRRPFPHELRAGVRFAELDRDVLDTAGALSRRAAATRDVLLDELADLARVGAGDSPLEAVERLRRMASPLEAVTARIDGGTLPPLLAAVDDVTDDVEAELLRLADRSSAELLDEARRQGLEVAGDVALSPDDRLAIRLAARRVAEQPVTTGLARALEAAQRTAPGAEDGAEVLFGALEAVEDATPAGLDDVSRQASSSAQGIGRTRAARLAPRPAQVYASELLDGATCGPCSTVDGRRYLTLEDALADYPGAGGFVFCQGGARCRGTLVYVWDTESAPTEDDATPPEGPSDPPDGPDGPIRPIPADDRTTFPRPSATVDLPGALPSAPLPPTTPPAADPASLERTPDPDLEALGDAAVRTELGEALRAGDQAAAIRYADELDRRAELGTAWRDPDLREEWNLGPDLTPEELLEESARIAAGMEEALPELVDLGVGVARSGGANVGRRIDRVRADYDAELYRLSMEAEHVFGIRKDRLAEYRAKYGDSNAGDLWTMPAHQAYYYAGEELREWWATHGRPSFAEYAVKAGITDRKTQQRAAAAARARDDAARRAEESGTERDDQRRRAKQAEARKRRATGPGAELERARRRMERQQRAADKAVRDLERQGVRVERVGLDDSPDRG